MSDDDGLIALGGTWVRRGGVRAASVNQIPTPVDTSAMLAPGDVVHVRTEAQRFVAVLDRWDGTHAWVSDVGEVVAWSLRVRRSCVEEFDVRGDAGVLEGDDVH